MTKKLILPAVMPLALALAHDLHTGTQRYEFMAIGLMTSCVYGESNSHMIYDVT